MAHRSRKIRALFAAVIAVHAVVLSLHAVRASAETLNIFHVPPKVESLPYPGLPISLKVTLKNTKDSERPLRLVAVKDGRALEVAAAAAKYNTQEQPEYVIPLESPIGELAYHFILTMPDGALVSSERYLVRRECMPRIDPTDTEIDPERQGTERLTETAWISDQLEKESKVFEQALKTATELEKLTKQ